MFERHRLQRQGFQGNPVGLSTGVRRSRLAQDTPNPSPQDIEAANKIVQKLEEGANLIIKDGKNLQANLDRLYAQYVNSATQIRLLGALRAAYNVLRVANPFLSFITGNVDNQALVKLQGSEYLGVQWMNEIQKRWFGGSGETNLHQALILVNDDLAQEVEATFNGVQQATEGIATLARQVGELPEEILSRGIEYYFKGLKDSANELWFDISSIAKLIKALLDAMGQASDDITKFLNHVFPKKRKDEGSSFPSAGTLLLVGAGALLVYLVIK